MIFSFFCMDEASARLLEKLDLANCWIVRSEEFETKALLAAKRGRAMNEYCWTCKPAILLHAFARQPNLDWAVYLDSDMMAFGNPDKPLVEAGDANVVLTPHRPSNPHFVTEVKVAGKYNAGYTAFQNSNEGTRALRWWLERCLELCPNVPVNGVYADQTYLNDIPNLFSGVHSSSNKGLNAAPWNLEDVTVAFNNDQPQMDDDPLLIYHFQAFKIYGCRLYDMYPGHIKISGAALCHIYRPYATNVRTAFFLLGQAQPRFRFGIEALASNPRLLLNKVKRWSLGINNLIIA